jgi:hypothetical protein
VTEKEEQVYKILLTPIKCDKKVSKIYMEDNVIYSPQKYICDPDEDMSDFSVGFYKIIYDNILKNNNGEILNEEGSCKNDNYIGDTMHSFNSLANVILGDGSQEYRSPKEKWPEELIEYESKYHCLANFWVIPKCHGRNSPKLNKYDSLDAYLNKVRTGDINNANEYFQKLTYESFLEIHGLSSHKILDDPLKIYISKDKKGCIDEIQRIYDSWNKRANEIVKKYKTELYDYFEGLGLIN